MIDLVVFDWNGTILADSQALIDAGNFIIQKYGGKPLSNPLIKDISKGYNWSYLMVLMGAVRISMDKDQSSI